MISLKIQSLKSAASVVRQIHPEMESIQYIPAIFNYVSQGTFNCKTPGLTLRRLNESAIITPYSDVVQFGSNCLYEKIFRPTLRKNFFSDDNLIQVNRETFEIQIKAPEIVGSLKRAYSMLGSPSSHWGHFISEYFPSFLAVLPDLPDDVVIVVPPDYDPIQIEFLKFALNYHGKNNNFYFCPRHQSVLVEELYCADKSSLLTDHGDWISIYDFISQDFCYTELAKFTATLPRASGSTSNEKIFLTRRANYRRVLNIDQVDDFFRAKGYTVVDPGALSHQERIAVFSGCKELAGIYSSAFFNIIYCPHIEQVKIIAPFARCIDQLTLNIFRPAQFTYFIADSSDQGAHPDSIISNETCENLVNHRIG